MSLCKKNLKQLEQVVVSFSYASVKGLRQPVRVRAKRGEHSKSLDLIGLAGLQVRLQRLGEQHSLPFWEAVDSIEADSSISEEMKSAYVGQVFYAALKVLGETKATRDGVRK